MLQSIESPTKSPNEVQITKEIVAWKAHFVSFAKQLTFLGVMHHCSNVVWIFFSSSWPKIVLWVYNLCKWWTTLFSTNNYFLISKISQILKATKSRKGLVHYNLSHGNTYIMKKNICWTSIKKTLPSTKLRLNLQRCVEGGKKKSKT